MTARALHRALGVALSFLAACDCNGSSANGGSSGSSSPALGELPIGERADVTERFGRYSRAILADLDGDGRDEIFTVDATSVRVLEASGREIARTEAPSGIQLLVATDLDGDRRAEVAAGWGATVDRRDGRARVSLFTLAPDNRLVEDVVLIPETERQDVAAIVPASSELLIAAFASKYVVREARVKRAGGKWSLEELGSIRMATSLARGDVDGDGEPDLVVARVYGDDSEADGDAFVLRTEGTRLPIPTTRGVRSLAVADLDGDGVAEVILGDGWHKSYGKLARSLLSVSRWRGGAFHTETIDEVPGQWAVEQIVVADLDGDGAPEIVTRGNAVVRAYRRSGDRWIGVNVAQRSQDVAAGELGAGAGRELLVAGDRVELIPGAAIHFE